MMLFAFLFNKILVPRCVEYFGQLTIITFIFIKANIKKNCHIIASLHLKYCNHVADSTGWVKEAT